jgi:hypothetical protein
LQSRLPEFKTAYFCKVSNSGAVAGLYVELQVNFFHREHDITVKCSSHRQKDATQIIFSPFIYDNECLKHALKF